MIKTSSEITLDHFLNAQKNISSLVRRTPIKPSLSLSKSLGKDIRLKLENMQDTGAFKLRGAAHKILSLSDAEKNCGIITMSSGNHGKSVAWTAKKLGLKAIIVVTNLVPQNKVNAIKELGAEVIICSGDQNQGTDFAISLAQEKSMTYISPFDDPDIIAGQGTIALEIIEDWAEVDTIIAPVSGGGLMSGIALAAYYLKPEIKIIGVTIEHGAAMYDAIQKGHLTDVEEVPSIADALQGPLPKDTKYTFPICRDYIDELILISDDQIKRAMFHALKYEKLVLEGGGAAAIALLQNPKPENLKGQKATLGQNIAVICSGDNVDFELMMEIALEYSTNDKDIT